MTVKELIERLQALGPEWMTAEIYTDVCDVCDRRGADSDIVQMRKDNGDPLYVELIIG